MSRQFESENWFTATTETAKAVGHQMAPPYGNIFIGCDPLDGMTPEVAKSFQAIVNVSCTPCAYFYPAYPGQYMHWFPTNEMGYWGYAHLFYIKQVLDFHHAKGHRVYLHCRAGAYRSPSAAMLWLMSKGYSLEEAYCIHRNDNTLVEKYKKEDDGRMWKYVSERWFGQKSGNVPDKFIEFFDRYEASLKKKNHNHISIADLLLRNPWIENTREVFGDKRVRRQLFLENLFPWYFEAKSYLRELIADFKRFMMGRKFEPINPGSRSGIISDDPTAQMYKFRQWLTPKVRKYYDKCFRGY